MKKSNLCILVLLTALLFIIPGAATTPVASFVANSTSGSAPFPVQFIDVSTNTPTVWVWSFGDGGYSTSQNPTHTYSSAGTYSVSLTVTNADGTTNITRSSYIAVSAPVVPVPIITANVVSGSAPLTVQFMDNSTHSPTAWAWTFGDGGWSTSQNPVHTYTSNGTFDVSLTATNEGGSNSTTKSGYITVSTTAPVASFKADVTKGTVPFAVQFTDTSTNTPTSWHWYFGDGSESTAQNPEYTYKNFGTYDVTLIATNSGGSYTTTKSGFITVAVAVAAPVASFKADNTSGAYPFKVKFTDKSSNSPTSWTWDFGDGSQSTSMNPSHTYADAGTYDVTLTVKNDGGTDTETQTGYIQVTAPVAKPTAGFTANITSGASPLLVQFTDTSTNSPTSWLWNFGDGNLSSSQNPMHTYSSVGNYSVSLKATNSGGSDTVIKEEFISVTSGGTSFSFDLPITWILVIIVVIVIVAAVFVFLKRRPRRPMSSMPVRIRRGEL